MQQLAVKHCYATRTTVQCGRPNFSTSYRTAVNNNSKSFQYKHATICCSSRIFCAMSEAAPSFSDSKGEGLDAGTLFSLYECVWGPLEGDDVLRWFNQEFEFSGSAAAPWGLRQRSGGPCGVLAAVQGYILYKLLFGEDLRHAREIYGGKPLPSSQETLPLDRLNATADVLNDALAHALSFVLWQASGGASASVVTLPMAVLPIGPDSAAELYSKHTFYDFEQLQRFISGSLPQFRSGSGVVLLVYSMLLSRGIERIQSDMDEPTSLVARFGHCSQELLNLVLTGEAVSGVFDGEHKLTDDGGGDIGLSLRGISRRPILGYLSHVEAMRYSKIGDFYKSPLVPIWVVGSESHLTVLFSNNVKVNEESPSAGVYRIFKKYDQHDNQFIPVDKLGAVLAELEVPKSHDAAYVKELATKLDSGNMGFIVWADFWTNVSPLLSDSTGGALGNATTTAAGAGRLDPSASESKSADLGVSFEMMKVCLRSAFDAADEIGGGFITAAKLPAVLASLKEVLPVDASLSDREVLALSSTLTAGQDPREAVILWSDLETNVDPILEQAIKLAKNTTRAGITTLSGERSKPSGGDSTTVSGSKRPRSDSEIARALYEEINGLNSSTVSAPANAPAPADPLLAPLDLSSLGFGNPKPFSGTAPSTAATAISGAGDAASRSAYDSHSQIRSFQLYHYNGIEDRGRQPRLTKISARQSDTGLPPVDSSQDNFAIQALNGTSSADDATATAIAMSLNPEEVETAKALAALSETKPDTKASALVNILRTKWPGVCLNFDGPAPSLD